MAFYIDLAAVTQLTPLLVLENATGFGRLVVGGLGLATIAALVVVAVKLASGRKLSGGSAYLSGLRLGGPIVGLLGACQAGFAMMMGVVNAPVDVTLKMMAPGFAEALMLVGVGFFAGAVAVIANWAVEARIDRQVLSV